MPDNVIRVRLKNRRLIIQLIDEGIQIETFKLIDKNEKIEDYKNAGFKLLAKNKIAFLRYKMSFEAFDEAIKAYLYLKYIIAQA